jgi:hypothetical protein
MPLREPAVVWLHWSGINFASPRAGSNPIRFQCSSKKPQDSGCAQDHLRDPSSPGWSDRWRFAPNRGRRLRPRSARPRWWFETAARRVLGATTLGLRAGRLQGNQQGSTKEKTRGYTGACSIRVGEHFARLHSAARQIAHGLRFNQRAAAGEFAKTPGIPSQRRSK